MLVDRFDALLLVDFLFDVSAGDQYNTLAGDLDPVVLPHKSIYRRRIFVIDSSCSDSDDCVHF